MIVSGRRLSPISVALLGAAANGELICNDAELRARSGLNDNCLGARLWSLAGSGLIQRVGTRQRPKHYAITNRGLAVLRAAATRTTFPPRSGRLPLATRVRQFFADNPDEELTLDDMAAKFDASLVSCRSAVKDLVREGGIESVHVVRARSKGMGRAQP